MSPDDVFANELKNYQSEVGDTRQKARVREPA